jgi:hypothetical protein
MFVFEDSADDQQTAMRTGARSGMYLQVLLLAVDYRHRIRRPVSNICVAQAGMR